LVIPSGRHGSRRCCCRGFVVEPERGFAGFTRTLGRGDTFVGFAACFACGFAAGAGFAACSAVPPAQPATRTGTTIQLAASR
jgi:hypothetical protein